MEENKIDFSKIIYIDMDDTICDYTSHFNSYRKKFSDNKYPQSIYKFFETIPPIVNAIDTVKKLNNIYDVWILTRPSVLNPLCYTEKRNWIENHLGIEYCDKLIISPNKTLLKGGYLIDDVKWDFEGTQLLYGSDKYKNWNDISKYFLSINLREIKILIGTNETNLLLELLLKNMKLYFNDMTKYNNIDYSGFRNELTTVFTKKINGKEEFIFGEIDTNNIKITPLLMKILIENFHIDYDESKNIILFFISMYTNKNYNIKKVANYDTLYDVLSCDIRENKLTKC